MQLLSSTVGGSTNGQKQQSGAANKNGSLLSRLLGAPQRGVGNTYTSSLTTWRSASPGLGNAPPSAFANSAAASSVAVLEPQQGVAPSDVTQGPPDLGFPRGLEERFTVGYRLGKGGNAEVFIVRDKESGVEYACKKIPKVLKAGTDRKKAGHLMALKQEIAVLKKLKGNLNIIELEAVYEDDEYVHIVTELCSGGELSFAIGQRHHSERTVASYMRAVLRTLAQCHAHHILHRDIKPGNFMLSTADERAPLRAIDFGLATPFEPEELPMTNLGLEGTPWFQAPEVLSSQVTPASDLWAAGVMAYQLLSGRMPFDDHRNPMNASITAIWRSILSDKLDMSGPLWAGISPEAKDCVGRLLERDPAKRPTAKEALKHPWLEGDSRERSTGKQLQQSVVARIQRFAAASEFKRSVLQMIASDMLQQPGLIPVDECVINERGRAVVPTPASACLEPLFRTLRFDENDQASVEQVSATLLDLGFRLSESELARLLEQIDPAGTGWVSRSTFAASQVDWRHVQQVHKEVWLGLVRRAFQTLDTDSDGVLRVSEIMGALERVVGENEEDLAGLVRDAMEESGQAPGEQAMDFNDFMRMLKASSLDSLDMYDERLAGTFHGASLASVDRLNSMLQRAGSGDSRHGPAGHSRRAAGAALGGADDSQHSTTSTTVTDRTHHSVYPGSAVHASDFDWSIHGGGDGSHRPSAGSAGGNGSVLGGSAWRFDVGGGVGAEAAAAAVSKPFVPPPGASMFRFDLGGPGSHIPPPAPTVTQFRFDIGGAASRAGASVAMPIPVRDAGLPPAPTATQWRFDVGSGSAGVNATASPSVGALAEGGGQVPDGRHHGSTLYKNCATGVASSVVSCRMVDRSLHGGLRLLEPVQE